MIIAESSLRSKIIAALKSQGFRVNPHLRVASRAGERKDTIKKIHAARRQEQLKKHKKFLVENLGVAKLYSISGAELDVEKIKLKLIEVKPKSFESKLFFWWNLVWWSLPYERPVGRQLRFLLWDNYHNVPFGIIGLQSPPLKCKARDSYLGINKRDLDYWINQSMYGQRVGALPPYNELLGGKMVALALTSNETRSIYSEKYKNSVSLTKKRAIPSRLLFITTTSAYGKSSIYERLTYYREPVCQFVGYTRGSGTFHLPEHLYREILLFLKRKGVDTRRGMDIGPSRKLRLVFAAFRLLGIQDFAFHGIRRGYYIFPHARNLHDVIQKNDEPIWFNRPFEKLQEYWMKRWCIPRSQRTDGYKSFNNDDFFSNVKTRMMKL